ncbi:tetratricopeptide repeat protein [Aquimarina aquimarini]|uniref:tetratricopeptide repeat protein n=1 Tax=Aquimarina aquimarini TaxID=1191734 RepID=UPI000D54EBE0|nr:hypothetical protein [Aquimarina aquimarini]
MIRLLLFLSTFFIVFNFYGQRQKKIDKIIVKGRIYQNAYVYKQDPIAPRSFIDPLTPSKITNFHRNSQYRVLSYKKRTIKNKKSGSSSTYVIEFSFLPENDLSYFFERFSNKAYYETKATGLLPFFKKEGQFVFENFETSAWTGEVQNGKLHGKGVGMINYDNNPIFFEGVYDQGIPVGEVFVQFVHIKTNYNRTGFSLRKNIDKYKVVVDKDGNFKLEVLQKDIKRNTPIVTKVDGQINSSGIVKLNSHKKSEQFYHDKAMTLVREKKLDELKKLAEKTHSYGFPESYYLEGIYYLHSDEFLANSSAEKQFKLALEKNVHLAKFQLANLYLNNDNLDKAERYFDLFFGETKKNENTYYFSYGKYWEKRGTKPEYMTKAAENYYKAYQISGSLDALFMAAASIVKSDAPDKMKKTLESTNELVNKGYKMATNIDHLYSHIDVSSTDLMYLQWNTQRRKNLGTVYEGDELCFRGGFTVVGKNGLYNFNSTAVIEAINPNNKKVKIRIKENMTTSSGYKYDLLMAMGSNPMSENTSVNGYGATVYHSYNFSPYVWISLDTPKWFTCK